MSDTTLLEMVEKVMHDKGKLDPDQQLPRDGNMACLCEALGGYFEHLDKTERQSLYVRFGRCESACRTYYGPKKEDEPEHLPKEDYYWHDAMHPRDVEGWFESDDAFRHRCRLKEKLKNGSKE